MKKIIIFISVVILFFILYSAFISYMDDREILKEWNEIESEFVKFNNIIINFYSNNEDIDILYVRNVYNAEIVSLGNSNVKVEMTKDEKESFKKLADYILNISYKGRSGIDWIGIHDNYIEYSADNGYFGIIYSLDGKAHGYREDLKIYHIKGNWYFQTIRYTKMFG